MNVQCSSDIVLSYMVSCLCLHENALTRLSEYGAQHLDSIASHHHIWTAAKLQVLV